MKNLIFFSLFLFISVSSLQAQEATKEDQAQEARILELMSKKIDIDVDKELFMEVTPNTYVSEVPKGVIMAMYVPQDYETSKEKIKNDTPKDFKLEKSGEKQINGVNVLFMTGTSSAEGVTIKSTIYCIEYDKETCIMAMGMIEENAGKNYKEAVDKAITSVVKKY
ncbi:hypothetical protein LX97_03306 [Nonlabens dokdonensis]|uniref:Uncharacterized protein n=2 Tax=Nonlabens dokdonensis TaxID=328515 RepID=L7W9N3_NONDD|nr:hypothetical protein [Nonlabens dokdonensis]AGC76937.1 hypothetical protein DDD_1810 [Nonlabens dokdonensis DSW-6]PZX36843.1 hypothetical protein LX97_03306 [Nonlabens dokdonensis]